VGAIRAGGTEFILIPVGAPLLDLPAGDLAEALARTPGARAQQIEDTWLIDLRAVG